MRREANAGLLTVALRVPILLMWAASASATTFNVTKTNDTNDGTCDADCSLREAVIAANANAGADTIIVPTGTYVLTLAGRRWGAATLGDLDITDTTGGLTLTGAGADTTIIDANEIDRVFHVLGDVTAHISGVTIRGGVATDGDDNTVSEEDLGGGVLNHGTLTLENSVVSGNSAQFGGGGIYSHSTRTHLTDATFTLSNCTVTGNSAQSGGGIVNASRNAATLTNCTVSGNAGGGIWGGQATLTNCTVSGNTGYGILSYGATLTNCTVSGNTGHGIDNRGQMTLTNCTLSGNSDSGIETVEELPEHLSETTLTNCTLSENGAAIHGVPICRNVMGSYLCYQGPVTVTNTIIVQSAYLGCVRPIHDGGHNIHDGTTCGFSTANGSFSNTDPLLDPDGLQDNGGPTETIALLEGSPAIGAGDPEVCANPPVNGIDQRVYVRSTTCSIGAYEYGASVTATPTNTPTPTDTPTPTNTPTATPTSKPSEDGGCTMTPNHATYAVWWLLLPFLLLHRRVRRSKVR